MNILILEDNKDTLEFIRILYNNNRHFCITANSYSDAMLKAKNIICDFVIADYCLDDNKTGLDFIEYCKAKSKYTYCVLLTGYDPPLSASKIADKIISKPVSSDGLNKLIEGARTFRRRLNMDTDTKCIKHEERLKDLEESLEEIVSLRKDLKEVITILGGTMKNPGGFIGYAKFWINILRIGLGTTFLTVLAAAIKIIIK